MAPVGSNHQAILAPAAEVKIPNLFEKERERERGRFNSSNNSFCIQTLQKRIGERNYHSSI